MSLQTTLDRIENLSALDGVAGWLTSAAHAAARPQQVKDWLHGVWLGHPVHPVLVQLPVGAWTSAAVLDALPGSGTAPDRLIALGLLGAVPAVATGLTDWSDLHQQQQRVGLVHASSNAVAAGFYVFSLLARRSGRRGTGRLLGWAGFTAAGVGGYIGGHLAYRQAAGPNHAEFVPHLVGSGWHDVGAFDELPDGKPTARRLGDVNLLVVRRGDQADVLANRCAHLDGPLAKGELTTVAGEDCVVCPWHGSTYRLRDGAVVHGPATAPQPAFRSQVVDGRLQVLLEGAG